MPLEKQTVSFPLAKGMDEKSSDKTRGHDTLEDCLNARMAKNGEIYKRGGFVTQGNTKTAGGTIGKGIAIAQYKDETLVFDQSRMYSKDGASTFLDKGQFVPCEFRNMPVRRELDRRQGNAHFVQVADRVDVYVWVECMFNDNKYRVMVTTRDAVTGATLLSPTKIMEQAAGTSGGNVLYQIPRPQCIGVGSYAFILWNEHDGSSAYNNIKYASVNCTSLATASAVSSAAILVDGSAAAVQLSDDRPVFAIDYAVNAHVSSGAIIMAFHPDGASLAWRIQYVTASGATLTAGDKIDILESAHASIFYPWTKGGHPVANEIMLKALNDNTDTAAHRQIVFATNVNDGSGNPDVLVWIIYANLSGLQVKTVETGMNDFYLIGGTCGTTSDGNDTIHLALELWDPAKTGATNVRVVEHRIKRFNFTRSSAALAQQNDVVAFNSSITSDMFRQDSRLYYTVTHVNSNTLVRDDGQQNSSNCIVLDQSDTMVAALPTGRSATCLTSEYVQRDPVTDTGGSGDIRRLLYGVQRITKTDINAHSFGASRFYGIAGEEAGTFSFSDYANNIFSISKIEMNFDQVRKFTSVDVDGSLVFTGGFLHGYDGEKIFENGFVVFPSIRTTSQANGGNGATGVPDGTYYYAAVYEWADSNGVIHRSAPSRKEKVVVDGSSFAADNPKVTIDVYVPNFTLKGDVLVRLYRTQAGPGAVFYEATSKRIASPATASYVSIVDFPSDNTAATITAQPVIYTQTELSNDFFGSCNDLVRHKDYLFAVASDDSVRYSKPLEDGTEARFPDAFTLSFPGESSRTAGIETNLDHLCIFTEDNGFFISGQGPTSAGQGDFTAPRLFAAGQGMVNGAPHVNSPVGNFIVTDRGIYLVGRDLSVKYIGAQVEDIDAYPKLNMLCHDATNEIRIMLTDPDVSGGTDDYLIYNYYFGQWTRWGITYTGLARHVAEIYDGTDFVRLTADGKTQKQSAAVFQDNNTGSSLSYNFGFTTTSIAPGGLLQAHRIYRFLLLGDYISDHTTTVKAYYDYSPSVTTTFTKSVTSANDAPMLLRAHLDKQKCRAVKFEVALSGAGQCATLDAVALEAGRRPTTFKPQTSRSERTM